MEQDGQTAFVRSLQHGALNAAVRWYVRWRMPKAQWNGVAILVSGDTMTPQVALVNAPKGAALEVQENKRIVAKLAKGTAAGAFQIRIWSGSKADHGKFAALVKAPVKASFARSRTTKPEPVVTQAMMNSSKTPDGAYATDVIAPERNPWNRRVRLVA